MSLFKGFENTIFAGLLVTAISTIALAVQPAILWEKLFKGEGGSHFAAVAELVNVTSEQEERLLRDCEKVHGQPVWSDIQYGRLGKRHLVHQEFACVRSVLDSGTDGMPMAMKP